MKAVVTLLLLLSFSLPLAAFAQTQQEWLTYENPDYGVRIEYPANNWTKSEVELEPHQVVRFITNETVGSLFESRPVAEISLNVNPTSENLTRSVERYENTILADTENYRLVNSSSITLTDANIPAHQIIVYYYGNEISPGNTFTIKTMQVWTIKDGYLYNIVYASEPGRFNQYLPIVSRMLDSFQITDTSNIALPEQRLQANQSTQDETPLTDELYNQCIEIGRGQSPAGVDKSIAQTDLEVQILLLNLLH